MPNLDVRSQGFDPALNAPPNLIRFKGHMHHWVYMKVLPDFLVVNVQPFFSQKDGWKVIVCQMTRVMTVSEFMHAEIRHH